MSDTNSDSDCTSVFDSNPMLDPCANPYANPHANADADPDAARVDFS